MTEKTKRVLTAINTLFPNAECELIHQTPFQLLIAVMLSAQSTDAAVNAIAPKLFEKFPTPDALAKANPTEVESIIKTLGLYKNKAKNLMQTAHILINQYEGQVPSTRDALETLPGVGRKTANVVLSVAFHVPALAVDTHVTRVSIRLGLANKNDSATQIELKLTKRIPKYLWTRVHHQFIFFGRYHCTARNPKCLSCPLFDICRYENKETTL